MKYKLERLWVNVRDWFNPQNKYLFKAIGNHWKDFDNVIEIVLFEGFKQYVEVELGGVLTFEDCPFYSNDEKVRKIQYYKDLSDIYHYIKVDRPQLQKDLEGAYPKPIEGRSMFDDLSEKSATCASVFRDTPNGGSITEWVYGKDMTFDELYGEVIRIEALLDEKDTWAMMEIVRLRKSLWT